MALVYGKVLIVGVDVAKKKHFARIDNPMGLDATKPFSFWARLFRLVSKISQAQGKEGACRVAIGMEPTGHYFKPLAWFLKEQGYAVVIINPYHVKKAEEMEDNGQAKDAGIIAHLVKEGRFQSFILPQGAYAELGVLSSARQQQTRKRPLPA